MIFDYQFFRLFFVRGSSGGGRGVKNNNGTHSHISVTGYRTEWKERGRERNKIKQNTHKIIVAKNVRRERGRERQQQPHTLHLKKRTDEGGRKIGLVTRYGIL